jgi:hypothetical protein
MPDRTLIVLVAVLLLVLACVVFIVAHYVLQPMPVGTLPGHWVPRSSWGWPWRSSLLPVRLLRATGGRRRVRYEEAHRIRIRRWLQRGLLYVVRAFRTVGLAI